MKAINHLLQIIVFTLCNLFLINKLEAQTAFAKAKDLKKIDQSDQYRNVVQSLNKGKKVPKWFSKLKPSERRILNNTALFFDAPLDTILNINLVNPAEFIRIVDAQNPKDTATEDLPMLRGELKVQEYDASEYNPNPVMNSTGLASPSAIIDGAARFLVKRTKEELEIAFFDEFRRKIEKDTILTCLLPETHRLLRYQDYFQVPSMGKTWTTAFEKDLHDVPLNLDKFVRTQCPQYLDTTALFVFSLGINCLGQVQEGNKLPNLLDNLSNDFSFIDGRKNQINRKIYNSLKFLNLLSNELVTSKEGEANFSWISQQDFKSLGASGQRYFWALFYAQNRTFFDKNIGKIKNVTQFNGSYRIVGEMLDIYTKLNGAISFPYVDDSAAAAALGVTQQLLRSTELFARIDTLFNPNDKETKDFFYKQFLPGAETTLSLMTHAQKQEYGAMSLQMVKAMEALLTPIYGKRAPEQLKTLFFYMNFMVDIITTDNAVSIERIIERYALPPQSYRLKRHSSFSLSLNAFPGLSGGYEKTQNVINQSNTNLWGATGGVTAPIGISINRGRLGARHDLSLSLFIPVIDIGAAFMYRWSDNAKGFPSDLRWSQVFSPGAYCVVGIPRMPISLAFGGQITPKLRDINTGTSVIQSNAFRFGINASVDVPFFNLYKKH